MDLVILGLSHHTAPVHVRERLDFSKKPHEAYLSQLATHEAVHGAMVLSTCNRVEVYLSGIGEEDLLRQAKLFLCSFHQLDEMEIDPYLYARRKRDAVRHLFRVASSLDSLVVGEPQILGQVKEAFFDSRALSLTDSFFDKLLQRTFSVAKKIRNETKIGENAVSISFAAVELAQKILGSLKKVRVMILGAGEMAELAAKNLKRQQIARMIFANRSYEHSSELAKEFGGVSVELDEFYQYLTEIDMMIVSTGAPNYLVKKEEIERLMKERKQSPLFMIDISVPRNVDPSIHELENVYLYNIDDLQSVVEINQEARLEEGRKAQKIIDMEVDRFYEMLGKFEVAPVIANLQEKYELVQNEEMERLIKRLGHLKKDDMEEIHRSMSTLVRKILNNPILFLNQGNIHKNMKERIELLSQMFDLETRSNILRLKDRKK